MLSFAGAKLWSKLDPDLKSLGWLSFKKHSKKNFGKNVMIRACSLFYLKSPDSDRTLYCQVYSILLLYVVSLNRCSLLLKLSFYMLEKTFGSI